MSFFDFPDAHPTVQEELASEDQHSSDDWDWNDDSFDFQPVVGGPMSILRRLESHGQLIGNNNHRHSPTSQWPVFSEESPPPSFGGFFDPDEPRRAFGVVPGPDSFSWLPDFDLNEEDLLQELPTPSGRESFKRVLYRQRHSRMTSNAANRRSVSPDTENTVFDFGVPSDAEGFSDRFVIPLPSFAEHHDAPRPRRLGRLRRHHREDSQPRMPDQTRFFNWALTPSAMSTRVPTQESLQSFESASRNTTYEDLGVFLTDCSEKGASWDQESDKEVVSDPHDDFIDSADANLVASNTDSSHAQVVPPSDPLPARRRPSRKQSQNLMHNQ